MRTLALRSLRLAGLQSVDQVETALANVAAAVPPEVWAGLDVIAQAQP